MFANFGQTYVQYDTGNTSLTISVFFQNVLMATSDTPTLVDWVAEEYQVEKPKQSVKVDATEMRDAGVIPTKAKCHLDLDVTFTSLGPTGVLAMITTSKMSTQVIIFLDLTV